MKQKFDILVVEDEPVVLAAVRKIVESENFKIDDAVDGESAIEKLKQNRYRLIISDLMLPGVSGLELIKKMKADNPCIPFIVITGYATLEKALQSFKSGSFDFIPKPFDTEALLGVVKRGLKYSDYVCEKGSDQHAFIHLPYPANSYEGSCDLYCLGCHSWVKLEEDDTAVNGVGETFPNMIEHLDRLEFTVANNELVQGKCCAHLTTKEGFVNMFWAPVSGRVVAYNHELKSRLRLIDSDPFAQGWLFRIVPSNLEAESSHLICCKKK